MLFAIAGWAILRALSPTPTSGVASPVQERPTVAPATAAGSQSAASLKPPTSAAPPDGRTSPPPAPCGQTSGTAAEPNTGDSRKESFSELTLFFFASGLALFVALLGWSDAIRGIDKDTKDLERQFLEDTGINKRDFLSIVKTHDPDKQLDALTSLMTSGKLRTEASVQLIGTFKKWNAEWSGLESLATWKYSLTVTLTVVLFAAGIATLFTTPREMVHLHAVDVRAELLVLMLPMLLVFVLLGMIMAGARKERSLRALLNSIAEMV